MGGEFAGNSTFINFGAGGWVDYRVLKVLQMLIKFYFKKIFYSIIFNSMIEFFYIRTSHPLITTVEKKSKAS